MTKPTRRSLSGEEAITTSLYKAPHHALVELITDHKRLPDFRAYSTSRMAETLLLSSHRTTPAMPLCSQMQAPVRNFQGASFNCHR